MGSGRKGYPKAVSSRGDSASNSLTGVWQGRYTYARHLGPVSFVATLIESGKAIHGTTHEPGAAVSANGAVAYALISGVRDGSHVTFTKHYENGHDKPIHYDGSLNSDATEIAGEWRIPGIANGAFIMIRSPGQTAKKKRKAVAPVDSR